VALSRIRSIPPNKQRQWTRPSAAQPRSFLVRAAHMVGFFFLTVRWENTSCGNNELVVDSVGG